MRCRWIEAKRRCEGCGTPIEHRRRGAVVCEGCRPNDRANHGLEIARWIEAYLPQPESGARLVLDPWQRDFLREAYSFDDSGGQRYPIAILSTPRKCGKTTLAAAIAVAELAGPWGERAVAEIPVGSYNREGAGKIWEFARMMCVRTGLAWDRENKGGPLKFLQHQKTIRRISDNGHAKCIPADGDKSMAMTPLPLILIDELGLHRSRDLFNAMMSSRVAHSPKMLCIGIRGGPGSPMNEMIASGNPKILVRVYGANADDDIYAPETWRRAIPAMGSFLSEDVIRELAELAEADPNHRAEFKARNLNMELDTQGERLLSREQFDACATEAPREGPCHVGLDLAMNKDLACAAAYWPRTGRLETHGWLPADPPLSVWSTHHDMPYTERELRGSITVAPAGSQVIDYRQIAAWIDDLASTSGVERVMADRWGMKLFEAQCSEMGLRLPPIEYLGQDSKSFSPAVAALERAFLDGEIHHGGDLLLRFAIMRAQVVYDQRQNRTLVKVSKYLTKKREAMTPEKIDAAIAACMAVYSGYVTDTGDVGRSTREPGAAERAADMML